MLETVFRDDARARGNMNCRLAAALFLVVMLLLNAGWSGQAWGQSKLARVGILAFSETADDPRMELFFNTFRNALADRGWIEGKTVAFEYRSAHGDPSRFSDAAEALVENNVDVIMATSAPSLHAAYAATRTIPIVASDLTTDPVANGYASSYARPGGSVTGIFLDAPEFAGKWFELLRSMVPDLSRVAVLWDPAPGSTHLQAVRSVARSLDITIQVHELQRSGDIDKVFSTLRGRPQAVILLPSPMVFGQSAQLARQALKYRLPATSMALDFASAGGAIAYGPEMSSPFERVAVFVAKILGGAKPGELPIERPTKLQVIVNLKTARTLGITIPQSILLRADKVVE